MDQSSSEREIELDRLSSSLCFLTINGMDGPSGTSATSLKGHFYRGQVTSRALKREKTRASTDESGFRFLRARAAAPFTSSHSDITCDRSHFPPLETHAEEKTPVAADKTNATIRSRTKLLLARLGFELGGEDRRRPC